MMLCALRPNKLNQALSEAAQDGCVIMLNPLSKLMPSLGFHGMDGDHAMKARVMPDGRVSLPAEMRRRHGLDRGGDVIVEDTGDAIVLRTIEQVTRRAQALSRKILAGQTNSSVDDFMAERRREAWDE